MFELIVCMFLHSFFFLVYLSSPFDEEEKKKDNIGYVCYMIFRIFGNIVCIYGLIYGIVENSYFIFLAVMFFNIFNLGALNFENKKKIKK